MEGSHNAIGKFFWKIDIEKLNWSEVKSAAAINCKLSLTPMSRYVEARSGSIWITKDLINR